MTMQLLNLAPGSRLKNMAVRQDCNLANLTPCAILCGKVSWPATRSDLVKIECLFFLAIVFLISDSSVPRQARMRLHPHGTRPSFQAWSASRTHRSIPKCPGTYNVTFTLFTIPTTSNQVAGKLSSRSETAVGYYVGSSRCCVSRFLSLSSAHSTSSQEQYTFCSRSKRHTCSGHS